MSRYCKTSKMDRIRQRLFFQYNKDDYTGAARLGEALLRAHTNHNSTGTIAYENDLYNVALACCAAGRTDRAIDLYTESIKRSFERDGVSLTVAEKLSNLAALLSACEQHETACRLFMQALTIRKRLLSYNDPILGDSLYNMGCALVRAGRLSDAIPAINGAVQIYSKRQQNDNIVNCFHVVARAYEKLGEFALAIPYAEAALRSLSGDDQQRFAYYLAGLYDATGRPSDACKLYLSVMEWAEGLIGPRHSVYINIATKAASQLAKLGDYHKSKDLLLKMLKVIEDTVGNNNLTYSNCIKNLAIIHRLLGEPEESEMLLREYASFDMLVHFPEPIT